MDLPTSFGYWVRRRRKALDLTQADLARRVGCAEVTIQKIEADERRPSSQIAALLAEHLSIPPAERATFLQRGRGELAAEQLPASTPDGGAMANPPALAATDAPAERLPSGTVTFLFTDIEGSTQLWEQYPQAMPAALARHDAILHQAIAAQAGVAYKVIGDAFQAAFATAPAACAAALAAQRALTSAVWDVVGALPVRMALHTCAAEPSAGDYRTGALNRLGRLLSAIHGGQIMLSRSAAALARESLPPDVALRDLGERHLRDLRPEPVYQLLAPDLPADFPALKTLDRHPHNLPTQPTALIGREQELAAIHAILHRADVRLLTLTGPGGIGKTRLALQAAAAALDDFAHGVYVVNLAPISDPAMVVAAIAQTLGVKERGSRPLLESLKAELHDKDMLLLLDNFEQVLPAAPPLAELLAACPQLKLLVTSREALHLYGEHEFDVPPLSLPDRAQLPPLARLRQYEAVRLFIARARAVKADFAVTNASAPAVAEICYRLDGLPLAIELAAVRVKLFSPQALLSRLEHRLALLTGGGRDLPTRHQTMRGAIDWSYHLLDATEQALFARLGVFAGGWTLEAAETLCAGAGLAVDTILDVLTQLVNKSLVVVEREQGEETRYRLLETIRQYAQERLLESGEEEGVRARHLDYFTALAEHADPELPGPKQLTWLNRLEVELDNLRAALQWSLETDVEAGLRMATALRGFWGIRGSSGEGRAWLSHLLRQPAAQAPTLTRANALYAYASLSGAQGTLTLARQLAEESLALYRELGDQPGIAGSLRTLGGITADLGDTTAGRSLLEESVALFSALELSPGLALALTTLGEVVSGRDAAQARLVLEESLAIGRALGDQIGIGHNLIALGRLALGQGDFTTAQRWLEESLAITRRLGNHVAAYSLGALGELAFHRGDYGQARSYYEESRALNKQAGQDPQDPWLLVRMGYTALRQGDIAGARATFEQSLTGFKEAGSTISITFVLEGLASLAVAQSRPELALRLFAWADATREVIGDLRPPVEQAEVDRDLATIRAQLDETAIAVARAEGRAMSLDQAIAYALNATTAAPAPSHLPPSIP